LLEIYCLIIVKLEFDHFSEVSNNLKSNRPYQFDDIEYYLATKYNDIFFGGCSSCSIQYSVFWLFVNAHCPINMNQDSCQACSTYRITMCQADPFTCIASDNYSTTKMMGNTCPYSICRANLASYLTDHIIWRGEYGLCGLTLLSLLAVIVNTFVARIYHKDTNRSEDKQSTSRKKVAPIEQFSQVEMISRASKSNHPSAVTPLMILNTPHDLSEEMTPTKGDNLVRSFHSHDLNNSPRNLISNEEVSLNNHGKFKGRNGVHNHRNNISSPYVNDSKASEGRAAHKANDLQLSHSNDSLPIYVLPAVEHIKGPYLL